MFVFRSFFMLLNFFSSVGIAHTKIILAPGFSELVRLPGLKRVATGKSRIVKVRPIPPAELLITGKKKGSTLLRVWSRSSKKTFEVQVLDVESYRLIKNQAPSKVVHAKFEFLELDASWSREFGVQWPNGIQALSRAVLAGSVQTAGLNYSIVFSAPRGLLKCLLEEGWGKIVARPELYVKLGEQATFHSGGEIPIATSQSSSGHWIQKVEWKPYGLTLKVTPQRLDGVSIRAQVQVDVSELSVVLGTDTVPAFATRRVQTKVNTRLGETVILSGIKHQASASHQRSLPWLGQIPLLGQFFQHKQVSEKSTDMLLSVTFSLVHGAYSRTRQQALKSKINDHRR